MSAYKNGSNIHLKKLFLFFTLEILIFKFLSGRVPDILQSPPVYINHADLSGLV